MTNIFKVVLAFLVATLIIFNIITIDNGELKLVLTVSFAMYILQIYYFRFTLASVFLTAFTTKFYIVYAFIQLISENDFYSSIILEEIISNLILYVQFICLLLQVIFDRIKLNPLFKTNIIEGINKRNLSIILIVTGFIFQILHAIFRPVVIEGVEKAGFGGFSNFAGISYLGLTIYLYLMSNKKLKMDPVILITMSTYAIFSLLLNTKTEFGLAILVLALSIISFNIEIGKKNYVYIVSSLILFVFVLTPIIHATRSYEYRTMSLSDKIDSLIESEEQQSNESESGEFLLDRFDILNETIIVVNGISYYGPVGYFPITDGILSSLPGFLVSKRSAASSSDKIMWHINEKQYGLVTRTTIGLVSSLFAIDRLSSVVIYFPVIICLFLLVLIKLFGNTLVSNPFSIFFLSKYLLFFTEKTAEGLIYVILRDLSFTMALLIMIVIFCYTIYGKIKV